MNIESVKDNDNIPNQQLINNLKNEQKNILKEIESLKNDMKNLKELHLSYQQLIQNAFIQIKTELKEDVENQIKEFKNQIISGLSCGGGW
jgi:predicted  nucleic acid-binding Zn-ribbon protein